MCWVTEGWKSTLDPPKKKWNASDLFGPQVISFTQKDRCGNWKVIWCQWPAKSKKKWKKSQAKKKACTKKSTVSETLHRSHVILNCTRRRHTQSDPAKIMLNKSQNICVEWKEGGWRRRTLNNITSMSLKLKSNLDLKTQVKIIETPQT